MREIKFRAWDREDKRMIINEQGFIPLKVTSFGVLRLSPTHEGDLFQLMPNSRFELMQYTGLKDKNGKEIYEGDKIIINTISERVRIVEFISCCFKCYFISKGGGPLEKGDKVIISFDDLVDDELEVIGNIHENPELL